MKTVAPADSYVEIARTWKAGDTVELVMPKTLRKEALADNPNRFAVMWGPLVLAGDLGPEVRARQAARRTGRAGIGGARAAGGELAEARGRQAGHVPDRRASA